MEHGEIEGSLPVGIAEIDVGTSLDEEIHNDIFIELAGLVKEQAPILFQDGSVFEVELGQVYVCLLIGILLRKVSLHPRIKHRIATEEFHAEL